MPAKEHQDQHLLRKIWDFAHGKLARTTKRKEFQIPGQEMT